MSLTCDFPSTSLFVQAFGIALLYHAQGCIDEDFDEGQLSCFMEITSRLPIHTIW